MRGRHRITLAFTGLLLLTALAGPALSPYDPLWVDVAARFQPPSPSHWFGTDHLGRDVFSRILTATRLDLSVALIAVLISGCLGTALGAVLGFFGGWADRIGSRLVEIVMVFTLYALALLLVAVLGNTLRIVVLATIIVNLPIYIRLARAETQRRRDLGYVLAARAGGSGSWRILWVFLIPNIAPALIAQGAVNMGWTILNIAGLAFLGLGIRPPTPEWGVMVAEGARYVPSGQWWLFAFPAAALVLSVILFLRLGEVLRAQLSPGGTR